MATIFCSSAGSNTSPYDTWAKAATSLQTAITQAADGDVVVLQYNSVPSGDAELAADTTYTFDSHCSLVSASNDGGSAYTLTAMGGANWIGNSTTNRSVVFAGADLRPMVWGLTVRTAGSTSENITCVSSAGQHAEFMNCYFWSGNTSTSSLIILASTSGAYVSLTNCTFRFGSTSQSIQFGGGVRMEGCSISASGSIPTTAFSVASNGYADIVGCDLSLVTGTLIGNNAQYYPFRLDRCKLGSGVVVLAAQTMNPTKGSPSALVTDCHSGDTHDFWGYYDALGSVVRDTAIYVTTGDAGAQSWKIVTTANASYRTPFRTPWIPLYHSGTSAITPRFEILRDGSTTAYTDAQVWAEFAAKVTAGSTRASISDDRQALAAFLAGTAGADQAAGAGLGAWTGESGTAWSGKIDSGSSITPAESGYLSGRIAVAAASATVYVEPAIRTA